MLMSKETKELKMLSDLCNLSDEELQKIYLKDEKTYERFIEEFTPLFERRLNYQLRSADHHDALYKLYKGGLEKYPSEKAISKTQRIVDVLSYIRMKYQITPTRGIVDKDECTALLMNSLGAYKLKKPFDYPYERVLKGIYESSLDYDNRGNYTVDDFASYVGYVLRTNNDPMDVQRAIEKYKIDHPLSRRNNNIDYLFFVNYMLSCRKDLVDDEFIKNAKGILDMSRIIKGIDGVKVSEDYDILSRFTASNIRKFEKTQRREDRKEKREQKRMVKQILKKNGTK